MPRRHRLTGALLASLAMLVAACGPSGEATPGPTASAPAEPTRIPVIVDTDLEQSDLAALAVLLRDPSVDLRAITIAGTGLVHCTGGPLTLRYVLDELGAPEIPYGCGREDGGPDAHPFPDEWRAAADAGYGLEIAPEDEAAPPPDAVSVMQEAVAASPSAPTIVALGPWTNLEDAFAADPSLADRVWEIHAMLGTIEAPGNVTIDGHTPDEPLEWNAFADPSAVSSVLATDVPLSLVPLDATDDVPFPAGLLDRLAADHAAGGADLVHELLVRSPSRTRASEGQQLWDELAALTVTNPDLATWQDMEVAAVDGPDGTVGGGDGVIVRDAAGRPARVAIAADRSAVETALLEALDRGDARLTPFDVAGEVSVRFDGEQCGATVQSSGPGHHLLTFSSTTGVPSGVLLAGVRAPATWSDLLVALETFDFEADTPPEWYIDGGTLTTTSSTGEPVTTATALEPATYGPLCFTGVDPDLAITPGGRFDVPD
jgi:pyrimidine-specific ribonucleoside hydrolase